MSELLQKLDFISILKQMGSSCFKWFNHLPKYQQIITCVAALTGSLASRHIYCKLHRKWNNYPPGPLGVPIFGFIPTGSGLSPTYLIKEYQEDNQDIVMYYIFGQPTVLISKMDVFQSTFKKQTYRHQMAPLQNGVRTFAGSNGDRWKHGRQLNQLSFTSLIKSNYLDSNFQELMQNEIFPELDTSANSEEYYYCRSDIKWLGFAFLFGVLYGAEKSKIPDKDNEEYHRFMHLDSVKFAAFAKSKMIAKIPIGFVRSYIQQNADPKMAADNAMTEMISKWEKETKHQRQRLHEDDTYFNRMEQHINNGEITYGQVCGDAMALVSAGLHVTLSSAEIAIYHACQFPDIQERVYQELKAHYDKYQGFEMKKMNELHIFRAFIYESLRYGAPVRATLSRNIMQSGYKIGKYNIPKGATIVGATYSMHRNPRHFERPNEFYVEHFIDDKNGHFKVNKNFVIFGVGKRNCIGQSLAIKELFVILSHMLHRYKFSVPPQEKDNWKIPESFFKLNPKKLPLIVERR